MCHCTESVYFIPRGILIRACVPKADAFFQNVCCDVSSIPRLASWCDRYRSEWSTHSRGEYSQELHPTCACGARSSKIQFEAHEHLRNSASARVAFDSFNCTEP